MKNFPPIPDGLADQAPFLTPHELEQLWRAAVIMADSRGVLLRLAGVFGRRIEALRGAVTQAGERLGGAAWADFVRRVQEAVEDTLWSGYRYATLGLEAVPHLASAKVPRGNALHRLATMASGAASGFVGLPGVLFDIPFTTTTILRSIAQVARDCGEDLVEEETRRACLQVLAFGGPDTADDDAETGYWVTRLGVNHLTVNLLINNAASRFGVTLSEKFLAQAVPVAGAFTGAALNYAFTSYYQNMARVHFSLRQAERRTGEPAAVQACFQDMVRLARARRRVARRPGRGPVQYLPRAAG